MKGSYLADLEVYRNPQGWIEFWIGLIALIAVCGSFGRIIYMEEMVKREDAEIVENLLRSWSSSDLNSDLKKENIVDEN